MSSTGLKRKLELAATARELEDKTAISGHSTVDSMSDADGSDTDDSDELPTPPKRRRTVSKAKPSTLLNAFTRTQLQRLLEGEGDKAMWQHLFCDQLPGIAKRLDRVEDLRKEGSEVHDSIDNLATEATVDGLQESVGEVAATAEEIQTTVDEIQGTTSEIEDNVSEIHSTVEAVYTTVSNVDKNVVSTHRIAMEAREETKRVIRMLGAVSDLLVQLVEVPDEVSGAKEDRTAQSVALQLLTQTTVQMEERQQEHQRANVEHIESLKSLVRDSIRLQELNFQALLLRMKDLEERMISLG